MINLDMEPAQKLSVLYQNLGTLIPPKLLGSVADPTKIEAIKLPSLEMGRLDDEYTPDLFFAVIEKDGLFQQLEIDDWDKSLFYHWHRAERVNYIKKSDRILSTFIASQNYPYGVNIESYILATKLRGQNIGAEFYNLLEPILQKMGYKYIWGNNNQQNINFFLRMGRYKLSQLSPESFDRYAIRIYPHDYQITIKFLDKELEEQCVKPEFLL